MLPQGGDDSDGDVLNAVVDEVSLDVSNPDLSEAENFARASPLPSLSSVVSESDDERIIAPDFIE